jgi:hypothetical protein
MQAPFWHVSLHVAPQAPQFAPSVIRSTHAPAQALYPVLHANVHELPLQAGVALATLVAHPFEHPPQFVALVAVFTHVPLQRVGLEEGHVHAELTQTSPPVHAYAEPQPPQLFASLAKLTHAPLQSV